MPTTKRRLRKPKIDFLKASQNRERFLEDQASGVSTGRIQARRQRNQIARCDRGGTEVVVFNREDVNWLRDPVLRFCVVR